MWGHYYLLTYDFLTCLEKLFFSRMCLITPSENEFKWKVASFEFTKNEAVSYNHCGDLSCIINIMQSSSENGNKLLLRELISKGVEG